MAQGYNCSQAAEQLVRIHQDKAYEQALLRAERARLGGDFIGYKLWKGVGAEAKALLHNRLFRN